MTFFVETNVSGNVKVIRNLLNLFIRIIREFFTTEIRYNTFSTSTGIVRSEKSGEVNTGVHPLIRPEKCMIIMVMPKRKEMGTLLNLR